MTSNKKLGIWMDHASAHVMEYTTGTIHTETIDAKFNHAVREFTLNKSENVMHNKEQHQMAGYYKNLEEIIKDYAEVILFGPTDAKLELMNILLADHRFAKTRIEIKQTDKMTENQEHAFVRNHFSHPRFQ